MRVAIATVQVPFIRGGAEILAENLKHQLIVRGHEAEIVTMPFKWYPARTILNCIRAARLIDLTEVNGLPVDRVICLKFPIYYTKHDNKVLWLLHQHRQAYELFGTEYGDLDKMERGEQVRRTIVRCDNRYLPEHRSLYTISTTVSDRLRKYNGISSVPLYHPPSGYEKLRCADFGDYVFMPGRFDRLKRQHLLVEAARYTKTPVRIVIAGQGDPRYGGMLRSIIDTYGLQDKVKLLGYISEDAKAEYYANALCVYYGPFQEDYGYVTLEAFFSGKPVITHPDSCGPLEFVGHGHNGCVVDPDPRAIAEALDRLYEDRALAEQLGEQGGKLMKDLHIDWDHAIARLLQ